MRRPGLSSIADRRERVAELFGKRDRRIAEILVDEGFFGPLPRLKAELETFVLNAKRTVNKDRHWIQQETERRRKELGAGGTAIASADYALRLRSRVYDAEEILEDPKSRPTARVQALSEIRLLEELLAKNAGVAVAAPSPEDPEGGGSLERPFLGIIVGFDKVSPEARAKIEKWQEARARG